MPRLSAKATLSRETVTAGSSLSGKLWINPTSSKASSSTVTSICLTARCRVRAEWTEANELRRKGESQIYRVEKQLLASPLEISGPKVLDFKIGIPEAVQRTATSWNASAHFESGGGHAIPPSYAGVVEHVLEIDIKVGGGGGFFRRANQTLSLPFVLVKTRDVRSPDPHMQIESRHLRHLARQQGRQQTAMPRRNTLAHAPAVVLEELAASAQPGPADYTTVFVTANFPLRLCVGGQIPIELTVVPGTTAEDSIPPDVQLKVLTVNVISHSFLRIKLAENTNSIDPEKETRFVERHCLSHIGGLSVLIGESTRIDKAVGGLRILAPEGTPTFRTYNVARVYDLELSMVLSIDGVCHNVKFKRPVHIDSGYYRAPSTDQAAAAPTTEAPAEEENEDDCLPVYSGPPPAYNSSLDNRLSLTTQARAQGVDIIDLL